MPWGRALRYAAAAIGAPYAVALLIVLTLVGLSPGGVGGPTFAGMALTSAIIAVASIVALALIARRHPSRSRMIAFGQALLACLLALLAALLVAGVVASITEATSTAPPGTAGVTWAVLPLFTGYAVGVVALFGTPLWVGAGVVAAAPLLGLPPRPELRAPGALASALALAVLAGTVALVSGFRWPADAASVCAEQAWATPPGTTVTAEWSWFPLALHCGGGSHVGSSWGWWPTFALGCALGGLALGLALWAANRPARPRTEVPQLPDEESIFP